jgi:hypothetical protein
MNQLFPLRIKRLSFSNTGTADLKQIATTHDGHDFAVRFAEDGEGIASSEWFGFRLAQACQIATPFSAALVDSRGRLGFGSRWESSTSQYSTMTVSERSQVYEQCGAAMSAVLALDIFCGNIDRHGNNWLFTRNKSGEFTPLCIDFSQAIFARSFPADEWPMPACNTTTTQAFLKKAGYWDGPVSVFTLEQIQEIHVDTVKRWLDDAPIAWMSENTRQTLLSWWGSSAYHTRLQKCFELI